MKYLKAITKFGLWLSILSVIGGSLIFTGVYLYLSPKLPSVDVLKQVKLQTPLRIYSHDNKLIGEFGEKRRTPIAYQDIPPLFIKAIYAAEDDRFMSHHGVDIKGLLRATSQLIKTGHIKTGGSTITMQVARNFFLSRKQTFLRKFNEIVLALQIERTLTKQEILGLYINKIYLGNRAYGIQAAAQVYYGKSIQQLSLAQLAMIAGLPKAPSAFNPIVNPARALIRRNWILGRMLHLDYIDQATYQTALNEEITARYHGLAVDVHAPYIAEMVRKKMLQLYGKKAYTDGYKVFTTVDSILQEKAQQAVQKGLRTYDQRHGYRGPEGVLPVISIETIETAQDDNDLDNYKPDYSDTPSTGVNAKVFKATFDRDQWLAALKNLPSFANQVPAVVTEIRQKSITVLLPSNQEISIQWQNGLKQARPFLTVNSMGPKPKTAKDIVNVGDIIRVIENEPTEWHLSQLPDAQAALVAISPNDGSIIALVGGYDYQQSKFNRATQAARQPGSNFKPFIYSAALEHGFTAASIINDAPVVFDDSELEGTWRPENSSGKFFGPTRLRKALTHSRNLVSIRLLRKLGVSKAIDYIGRFGFDTSKLPKDLSLALGTHALTPMEIVKGYGILANGGYKIEPYVIDKIVDINGDEVFHANPPTVCEQCNSPQQPVSSSTISSDDHSQLNKTPIAPLIMDKRVVYIINSMLKDVIRYGTGRSAKELKRNDIAGKTGTTNGPKDAWFSGFNRDIAVTTWVGFDQNRTLGNREYGGSAALPIWKDFMHTALANRAENFIKQPDGIITVKIDPKTGKRASQSQRGAIFEIFRRETVPDEIEATPGISNTNRRGEIETIPDDLF